ncbi:hypothetical protein [Oscillatoria sp. FACHB-1406]|uniref:hypothetical protein n=1 Tax=Oscillatoria sp. FACHB-1406 TaxID=2692846 RepID=UPI0016891E27|nr:hypothetical protein [Oscillatoria sp. FACHB-1406]MBD2579116.1 hypothetical protein [Oscillatoria sp. FACHB-1406]
MRDRILLFCTLCWASALPIAVNATELAPQSAIEVAQQPTEALSASEAEFWARSQALIEEQLEVLGLLEAATVPSAETHINGRVVTTTQSERQNAARDRLWQHLLKLERYLRDIAIVPEFICRDRPIALPSDFTPAQQQTYCSLFYTQQLLQPLSPFLDRRTTLLRPLDLSLRPTQPLPLKPANGDDTNGSAFSASVAAAEAATPEPVVVSQPVKKPEANGNAAPTSVAIPNSEAIYAIETSRRLLLAAQNSLPAGYNNFSAETRSLSGSPNYLALYPEEIKGYEDVLEQPNTGIATIFPEPPSPLDLNQLRDRLYPEMGAPRPFVPLETLAYGFLPRLALKIEGESFAIATSSLTYGFMVDLGDDIDFEDFPDYDDKKIDWYDRDFNALTDAQRELFVNYRPPQELRAIEADQRRFFFDKLGLDFAPTARPPAVSYAPARVEHTYLLRLIQYQLPAVILNNEPIPRDRRRHAGRILQTPSSDLAIAFRPLRRNPDGSYVVLWKVVKAYPKPEIKDLGNYANFQ